MTWNQSLHGARRTQEGHSEAAHSGPFESGGYTRLGMESTEQDYANLPPIYLPYHSDLTFDQLSIGSLQNSHSHQSERNVEVIEIEPLPSFSHDYYLNRQYSQREQENEYSYLYSNNFYSISDPDNNGCITTPQILKDDAVPYHDPTCTVANCQRPSCLVPDFSDIASVPYHSLTTNDQSDSETECLTCTHTCSQHNKQHRYWLKNDTGSLNAPHPAAQSFRDAKDTSSSEGVPDSLKREKRPLSGSDVLRMSPR